MKAAHAIAAASYVAVALWAMRAVLPDAATRLPYPELHDSLPPLKLISQADQRNEMAAMLRNAHLLLRDPSRLLDGDCFPVPRAATLGEHMFGEGLAAALPYAVTGEPILTYNAVLVLWIALAGVSMYALAWHWTGSAIAAFVAGLLFAIHPARVGDPEHPFIHADFWIPLALLFFHRLVVRERWWDAAALVAVIGLQLLESAYNVLELGIVGATYAIAVLAHHRRRLPALLPKLVAVAATCVTLALAVFVPFARTRAVWTFEPRVSFLVPPAHFLPGAPAYSGTVPLLLAAAGLLDRLRRRGSDDDPRFAMLLAGLLCVWLSARWRPPAGVGFLESPLITLMRLDMLGPLRGLRGLHLVFQGELVAIAFLAAWGTTALVRRLPTPWRPVTSVMVAGAALVEVFHPTLAHISFGRTVTLRTVDVRPPQQLISLYTRLVDGPVLDLPFSDPANLMVQFEHVPYYALLRTFHQHPVAACATSLGGPAAAPVAALAARLPDPRAADALHAIGFRNVVMHEELLGRVELARWRRQLAGTRTNTPRLALIGRAGSHEAFALESSGAVDTRRELLAAGATSTDPGDLEVSPPRASIPFSVVNRGALTYRHPDPIEPTAIVVHWQGLDGESATTYETRVLLPLALAPGDSTSHPAVVPVPGTPGLYDVALEWPDSAGHVIAHRRVRVGAARRSGSAPMMP
jgi:hypothetical protein